MKSLFASTLVLIALPLCAQTAATPTPPPADASAPAAGAQAAAMSSPVLQTLTPDEKTKLMTLHGQVLDQNPDLKKEELDLMQRGMAMQAGGSTDADRQAFMTEARAHADKIRAAMLKTDPSVQTIFAKITAEADKLKAQAQAAH